MTFILPCCKASSFSVVKQIPEIEEIKLGEVDLCDLPG